MNEKANQAAGGPGKSMVNNLKAEWSLFWDGISGDFLENEPADDSFASGRVQPLTLEQVKEITKGLSKNRRQVNQKIESVNKEIESISSSLESIRLVSGEDGETLNKIHQLSDQGQALSQELSDIDQRLKKIRQAEEILKKKMRTV